MPSLAQWRATAGAANRPLLNGTLVPFTNVLLEANVSSEQTSGEGCSNERPATHLSLGRVCFGAVFAVSPTRWNMFSLWYVFALRVKCRLPIRQRERELGRVCRFSARRRQSPVVRGNPGDRLAQGNGRGSHTGNASLVWHRSCCCSNREPLLYSARLHSPDSRFARESPRFSKIAHVDHLALNT